MNGIETDLTAKGPARQATGADMLGRKAEVEILEGDPDAVLARIRDLFREARLAWRPAPIKPARCFAALASHAG